MNIYAMGWTQKDGKRVDNQLFTAGNIDCILKNLEEWEATDITLRTLTDKERKEQNI